MKNKDDKTEQQNEFREILDLNLKVTEEMYLNPKFKEPVFNPVQANANEMYADNMMDSEPQFLKRSHFSITGTINDGQLSHRLNHVFRNTVRNNI